MNGSTNRAPSPSQPYSHYRGQAAPYLESPTQPQNRKATHIAMPPQTQRAMQPPSRLATLLIQQLTNHPGSHIGMLSSQTSVATKPKGAWQPLDWSASA